MKTQGEIEAAICEVISRFEQEYMGGGPKDTHAHLIRDLLIVHWPSRWRRTEDAICSSKFGCN